MPGRLRLRQLEKERTGARRDPRLGSLAPSGPGLTEPGQLPGLSKVWTGKGMGEDTPERTRSAAGWHELQTYKHGASQAQLASGV